MEDDRWHNAPLAMHLRRKRRGWVDRSYAVEHLNRRMDATPEGPLLPSDKDVISAPMPERDVPSLRPFKPSAFVKYIAYEARDVRLSFICDIAFFRVLVRHVSWD